jgi:hypothetical protein
MVRLLWAVAWTGVAFWSLFAFAAYGLVDLIGGLIARNADMVSDHPETVEGLFNLLQGFKSFGLGAILVVWGFVSLSILSVPWLLGRVAQAPRDLGLNAPPARLLGGFFGPRTRAHAGVRPPVGPAEPGVLDLPPDQYASDTPRRDGPGSPPGQGGSVPRVTRG